MIVGSLLLILVAVGLLVAGVLSDSNVPIIGSIGATVIAAVVLIIGVRLTASGDESYDRDGQDTDRSRSRRGRIPTQSRDGREPDLVDVDDRTQVQAFETFRPDVAAQAVPVVDEDPPGEPSAQMTSPADAARVASMATEVIVIDGRPRYHLSGCVHLLGRDSEPLPVGEALELGFTPCGLCEPDSALLAEARQR